MKKELSIRLLFFIGITTIFMGCQEDLGDKPPKTHRSIWNWFSNSDAADISKAQEWYQKNGAQAVMTKAGQHPLFDEMVPYWRETYVRKDKNCKTVEVALNARRRRKFIDGMCSMMYEESKDQKYLQSLTRLIIKTDLQTNEVQGFFMTIVPSLQYLQECHFKPFVRNTYTERDRNFDGYVYYHELNGDYANGWKYVNGKITHTMEPANGNKPVTKSYDEEIYCQTVYELDCTDWYTTGEYTDESGTHSINNQYVGTTCRPGATGEICWKEESYQGAGWGDGSGGADTGNTDRPSSGGGGGYNPPPPVNPKRICPVCKAKDCTKIHEDCQEEYQINNEITKSNFDTLFSRKEYRFNANRVYPSYEDFLDAITAEPNKEHSSTLFYYPDEKLHRLDEIRTGTENSSVAYGASDRAVADIHSHPSSHPSLPSILDLLTTAGNAAANPMFKFMYIYVEKDIYAFYVVDRVKATAFHEKYAASLDTQTNLFFADSIAGQLLEEAKNQFKNYGNDIQYLFGLADFLDTQDSGIRVLKKPKDSTLFESITVTRLRKEGIDYVLPVKCNSLPPKTKTYENHHFIFASAR